MALTTRRWSRNDLRHLPDDGNRYEVLGGQLFVTPLPGPPHQWIATRLAKMLSAYVERHDIGCVVGPGAVVFDDNELQPDVVVFPVAPSALTERWDDLPTPLLCIEVLSRTTQRRDLGVKRVAYQQIGVGEYWVVDPFRRCVSCRRGAHASSTIHNTVIEWHPRGATDALRINVPGIMPAEA